MCVCVCVCVCLCVALLFAYLLTNDFLQALSNSWLKIDSAVTLSFSRVANNGAVDYLFPLFPRKGLNSLFPSIEGKAEHYCGFSLADCGSVTFRCNLESSCCQSKEVRREYLTMLKLLSEESMRVKVYYPLVHTLRLCLQGHRPGDMHKCYKGF